MTQRRDPNGARRVRVLIEGRVQGVCFRAYTQEKAESLGLSGWVRNLADGRVEAVFEGAPEPVEAMLEWCRHGPPAARVRRVECIEEAGGKALSGFEIRYGA